MATFEKGLAVVVTASLELYFFFDFGWNMCRVFFKADFQKKVNI